MYNIKSLLTEELILNDKKNQLNEHTLIMISDPMYIKHVLGIDVPLNEYYSFALRKKIIEEALSMQGVLASANKFLGAAIEKGKETAIMVIDTVKSTKDIVMLFRDVILSPENMDRANKALNSVCNKLGVEIDKVITFLTEKLGATIAGFTDKMIKMLTHVKNVLTNIISSNGWLGFLSKLGFTIILTFVKLNFLDKIINMGLEFIKDGNNLFNGIAAFFNMFENFKKSIINSIDVSGIISWITSVGAQAASANLTLAFDILVAVTAVTAPVIKSMQWQQKLQKK
jgi:hypothetical protein